MVQTKRTGDLIDSLMQGEVKTKGMETVQKTPAVNMIQSMVDAHIEAVNGFFMKNAEALESLSNEVATCLKNGGKVLLCGNGGSASDAQHIAAEFVGRFVKDRRALASIALTTDTSILTAVGNDYGYDEVFSRQVEGLGREGDVLVAISTSGNSGNIIKAVQSAHDMGIIVKGDEF